MTSREKKGAKLAHPTPTIPSPGALEQWVSKRFYGLAAGVLALALALRIGLLVEFPSFPYSDSHRGTDLDTHFFNLWAEDVAGGDFLTDTILHPYHAWHDGVARAHGAQDVRQGIAMWSAWYGGKTYHQEPMYTWFIALFKIVFGSGLLPVYIAQMGLGLLSVWMIMLLGRRYAGALAGIAGGLLFTFYSPAILFDVILLRTTLQTTVLLGMVWTSEQLLAGKRLAWLMGLLGGIGYLLASTFMLLWIPLVARWLYLRRGDLRVAWQTGCIFGLFIGVLVVRNTTVGAPAFSISSVGPVTYALSNYPGYNNRLGFSYYPEVGILLDQVDGSLMKTVLASIGQFPSIMDWIALQFNKLAAVFHWHEIPNNVNSYLARAFSPTLKLAFVPYSLIAGLGLWGWLLHLRDRKTLNLVIALLTQVAVMVGFYVLCRFRIPFAAGLAVFAGIAVQAFISAWRTAPWRGLLHTLVPLALWGLVARPWPEISLTYDKGEYGLITQYYLLPRLEANGTGNMQGNIALFEQILTTIPPFMRNLPPGYRFTDPRQRELSDYYGRVYFDLGGLYRDTGQAAASERCFAQGQIYFAAGAN
jgi:hypothetical protein